MLLGQAVHRKIDLLRRSRDDCQVIFEAEVSNPFPILFGRNMAVVEQTHKVRNMVDATRIRVMGAMLDDSVILDDSERVKRIEKGCARLDCFG